MVARRETDETPKPRRRPATTPEARENQMVSLAVNLAEKQMRNGTASSQVVVHYLKLGSTREKLEQERLANENLLLTAKVEQLASGARIEDLMQEALRAFSTYQGNPPAEGDYDEQD